MSGDEDKASAKRGWIHDNPYLLLALAALFWSGNHIVGRAIGGKVPPIGISTVRWLLPTVAIGFLAFPHIRRDWPVIRAHWGILLWLGIVGGALFTAGQYIGLAIAYVSIFPSLLAFAAWNRGVQLIGANRSGPFVHLVPVYTAILGGVLLNEHLSTFHIFGAALIIAGVWIAARFSSST
jgi:drug/metabolite transporter (DMT)-like permease